MASIPIGQSSLPLTSGTPLVTSTGGGSGNTSTSTGTGSTSPTQSLAPASAQAPQPSLSQINSLNSNFDFSPLLGYVGNQGTAATNALNTAQSGFTSALGSTPTFGTNDQNTLSAVLNGQQPLSTGQSMLNTSYSGPTSLNDSSATPFISNFSTLANETTSPTGIQNLESTMNPGLSSGDTAFDAEIYGSNPNYQSTSQNLISQANTLQGQDQSDETSDQTAAQNMQQAYSAYNQAGQSYVQGQLNSIDSALANQIQQASQTNQNVQNTYGQLQAGAMPLSSVPTNYLGFAPSAFQATNFTSPYGANVFNQTVNPTNYLSYAPAVSPTMAQVATPQQITEYNNANQLLGMYNELQASPYTGAQININSAALQQALASAQNAENAANAAWLASQVPVATGPAGTVSAAAPPSSPGNEAAGGGSGGDSGGLAGVAGSGGDAGGVAGGVAGADEGSADTAPGTSAANSDAAEAGADEGADGGDGDGGDGGGNSGGAGSGGGGGEGGAAYLKGGFVHAQGSPSIDHSTAALANLLASRSTAQPNTPKQSSAYSAQNSFSPKSQSLGSTASAPGISSQSVLSPAKQASTPSPPGLANSPTQGTSPTQKFAKGGFVHAKGTPAQHNTAALAQLLAARRTPLTLSQGGAVPQMNNPVQNSIPARVNDGEYVIQQPAVAALGQRELAAINRIASATPAQQAVIRNALATALTQAHVKGFADGGLTTKARDDISSDKFALPGRRFPVENKAHARAAELDAPKAQRAGNITAAQRAQIDNKARQVLAR